MKTLDQSSPGAEEALTQYAALCHRKTAKGRTEVLLITSRDTGRWVIPKGWPMKGKSGAECALREAYEEAGVEGDPDSRCIGLYAYDKGLKGGAVQPCVVAVYPVRVRRLKDDFPEKGQRVRKWFSPRKAASRVAEPELSELLSQFDPDGPPAENG
ncbi:NUDIX hydrolase [Albidovulum sp.]|uniref:NUDIX hydrolase n=1 Tax=Albidovulum sp. TaxID=1872424 RepID=UPI001D7996A0|nr:NUDIX hydrolase [Paracoccaceae bacterium]MCC0047060.1 NUDIX hydrolase [Defluviimonas sp.]HPE26237.1 NUDIX hydrolase [Albidovulum sp.]MCB2118980.1 NUDIX hydrolase [Paracoccaceae bacterium]MCB2123379.1 NUDIX hydrolase [Paracoccaceae bacterium]